MEGTGGAVLNESKLCLRYHRNVSKQERD